MFTVRTGLILSPRVWRSTVRLLSYFDPTARARASARVVSSAFLKKRRGTRPIARLHISQFAVTLPVPQKRFLQFVPNAQTSEVPVLFQISSSKTKAARHGRPWISRPVCSPPCSLYSMLVEPLLPCCCTTAPSYRWSPSMPARATAVFQRVRASVDSGQARPASEHGGAA